jgi:hypothetical protein
MEATAQSAYTVRYLLQHPDDVRFALTFTVTGEEAELVLLQSQERTGAQDIRANPGRWISACTGWRALMRSRRLCRRGS